MTDMTGFNNATSFVQLITSTNTATGGIASLLVLIALFIITLVGLLRSNPPQESIMTSGAVCTFVSLLLLAGGMTDIKVVIGFMLIFALGAISLALNK